MIPHKLACLPAALCLALGQPAAADTPETLLDLDATNYTTWTSTYSTSDVPAAYENVATYASFVQLATLTLPEFAWFVAPEPYTPSTEVGVVEPFVPPVIIDPIYPVPETPTDWQAEGGGVFWPAVEPPAPIEPFFPIAVDPLPPEILVDGNPPAVEELPTDGPVADGGDVFWPLVAPGLPEEGGELFPPVAVDPPLHEILVEGNPPEAGELPPTESELPAEGGEPVPPLVVDPLPPEILAEGNPPEAGELPPDGNTEEGVITILPVIDPPVPVLPPFEYYADGTAPSEDEGGIIVDWRPWYLTPVFNEGWQSEDGVVALPLVTAILNADGADQPIRNGGAIEYFYRTQTIDPLTTTDATAPVPVPAAVWLFSPALAALGAFARRRKPTA